MAGLQLKHLNQVYIYSDILIMPNISLITGLMKY